jgi:hypothetical protein
MPVSLPTNFFVPETADLHVAIEAKRTLWNSPDRFAISPYLASMDTFWRRADKRSPAQQENSAPLSVSRKALAAPLIAGLKYGSRIIVAGEAIRATDIQMMSNLVHALCKGDHSVVYLTSLGSVEHQRISRFATEYNFEKQIEFRDLHYANNRINRLGQYIRGLKLACDIHSRFREILPRELHLTSQGRYRLLRAAVRATAWHEIRDSSAASCVILRNHYRTLSSAIALDALASGIPVISFQHGVVSSSISFVPLLASNIVTFGKPSAETLRRSNGALSQELPPAQTGFTPGGVLFDTIPSWKPRRQCRTVLILDSETRWAKSFYAFKFEVVRQAAESLLRHLPEVRLLMRPHPDNDQVQLWSALRAKYPGRLIISDRSRSLATDLLESDIALSLFSGALTTAAAAGMPVLYLWDPGWYFTPDLLSFARCFVNSEELVSKVGSMLESASAYEESAAQSQSAAQSYYQNGEACHFDQAFVTNLLSQPVRQYA